ncbi:uncharacterized protein LOC133163110 isoform X1 [Syngnathus typhle]|uniref:uncharacterized protein LOC133163110 isoform X1 n=1 Tax=Syngnathus typhle TaxID=161592 RepID=UPI002A6B0273|nr:uncharacterized protein LOC133163110 isoform X1 [Syngnathus typhle]
MTDGSLILFPQHEEIGYDRSKFTSMIGASSVSGDTLIACHFPLLPLPAWQLPVQALCGSARRPGFSGLPRAASLPEQDKINEEHPIAIHQKQFSNSFGSLNEDRGEEEEEDATSDCVSASSPEETKKERARGSLHSHNSFLPNPDLDEDDEDSDGDNLHKYLEDSSFVLHGTSNWHNTDDDEDEATHRNMDWGHDDLLQAHNKHESPSEMFRNSYASDSSCGSSDGVLVNFGTMYNHSNNPAVPHDLSGPAVRPSPSPEGSIFLNLRPLPNERDASPLEEELFTSRWSTTQDLDSNHPPYENRSSLEVSDLATQAALVTGTNQTYYKLVTCDLSPNATWSNIAGRLEDESVSSPEIHFVGPKTSGQEQTAIEDQQREDSLDPDFQLASTSNEKSSSGVKKHFQNRCHLPCFLCFNHSCSCQVTNQTSTQEQSSSTQEQCTSLMCSIKPQRPTSLPIQPMVLGPGDNGSTKAQQLGCLVEQYIKQKTNKKSQLGFKPNPKLSSANSSIFMEACSSSDTCSTCTPSPGGINRRNIYFQGHRSPRTSKTITQTDSKLNQNRTSPQTGPELLSAHCQPKFMRIPTYQDLISLTTPKENHQSPARSHDQNFFESIFSDSIAQTNNPYQATPLPQSPQAQGFSFTATFSSMGPLSSLGSLLSFADPARQHRQTQRDEPLLLSDRAPTDLSPDTSYESLSISHLQRRGLLRSVSRAVDLIIAHFGNSRDPEEKMRLGNSYLSAMMASLVLDHLCPAIQNILEDGLRDHKLDLIIGQRRNSSWTVVEVSTKAGPPTKVLYSLVCKIIKCPQLNSHSMRLKAFIMGLLNLRALEFWLSHLYSQRNVVTSHYHGWGFLSMSLGRCRPLFQELLLLLQPLSVLPFDLDLLLEPRLLQNGQACVSLTPLFAGFSEHQTEDNSQNASFEVKRYEVMQINRRQVLLASDPEWRNSGEGVVEDSLDGGPLVSMDGGKMKDNETTDGAQVERPGPGGLRWAKLFGASRRLQTTSQSQVKGSHRPSQWLHLDRSHLGLLTQSIRSLKP